jgi:hypothetical protein
MQNKRYRASIKLGIESAGEETQCSKTGNHQLSKFNTDSLSFYSWATDEHKSWVPEFAGRLRADEDVDVTLISERCDCPE